MSKIDYYVLFLDSKENEKRKGTKKGLWKKCVKMDDGEIMNLIGTGEGKSWVSTEWVRVAVTFMSSLINGWLDTNNNLGIGINLKKI